MPRKSIEYSHQISVKLDKEQYEMVSREAKKQEQSKSQFVRWLINRRISETGAHQE